MAEIRICSVEGCGKPHDSHGFCGMHYMRVKRYGDVNAKPKIVHGSLKAWIRQVAIGYEGDDCLIWPFSSLVSGYAQMKDNGKTTTVSRYICMVVHGHPPTGIHEAAHSCGNGTGGCVNPRHIRWATHQENESDKIIHGTRRVGERTSYSKLQEKDVLEIFSLAKSGGNQRKISEYFDVSQPTVNMIARGKSWKHLRLSDAT